MAASYDLTAVLDAPSMLDASAAALELPPSSLAPASTPGFAVRLPCAQLGDLIQINCLNRIRGAFRVSSGQGDGFLFFEGGQLVHASCGDSVGLDAVVVMLGWRSGSIEPSELAWPEQRSIGMGADALLLHAAQRLDERARDASRHDATTKVVRRVAHAAEARHAVEAAPPAERRSEQSGIALRSPFASDGRAEETRCLSEEPRPQRGQGEAGTDFGHEAAHVEDVANAEMPIWPGSTRPSPAQRGRGEAGTDFGHEAAHVEDVANAEMPIWPGSTRPSPAQRGRGEAGTDFGHEALSRLEITRVAPNGKIERLKAGASTDLADTAFYCQRLATLVGEGLGLGPCRALACESADEGIVVFQGRSIVGARGALADLEFVLAKVGLE
jgi:hypothetical protein